MRLALAALALAATAPVAAQAQVYVTSIIAVFPDPNGKVPTFNGVPGAGIPTWANGLAQAVLTHGTTYNYCLSIGTGTAVGKASVVFRIVRGKTILQSGTILTESQFSVVSNAVYYECAGFHTAPDSPGAAALLGIVNFVAKGTTKAVVSKLSVPILLE
jgi:hypothetical protein